MPLLGLAPQAAAASFHQYVALGDSYASAAGQAPFADIGWCNRSNHNYPSLVADFLGLSKEDGSFIDATCSGATTNDVLGGQINTVSEDTDLVTLTVGGDNNGFFMDGIIACNQLGPTDPGGTPCKDHGGDQRPSLSPDGFEQFLDDVRTGIVDIVEDVHARAPKAKVLVVDYPRLSTPQEQCPERGTQTSGDIAWLDSLQRRISTTIGEAAAQSRGQFVEGYSRSAGHGICAGDQAWIAGNNPAPGQALAYHPLPEGSEGWAKLVIAALPPAASSATPQAPARPTR